MVTAHQIILATDVTNQANDVRQLAPMIARTLTMMEAVTGDEAALGVGLFDAGYWSDENAATETAECEYLIATTKDWKQRKAMREAPPPRGRMPRDMSARDQMERKLLTQRGRKLYRLRGQTVEPVFGQMKETQGADGFMMCGEQETKGEWNLHCAAHNIKKLHSEPVRRGRTQRKKRWKMALELKQLAEENAV